MEQEEQSASHNETGTACMDSAPVEAQSGESALDRQAYKLMRKAKSDEHECIKIMHDINFAKSKTNTDWRFELAIYFFLYIW